MKRLILCVLCFALGLGAGASVRFTQHWQRGYLRGYFVAMDRVHREAVRAGHGHWERAEDSLSFQWNPVRQDYAPDRLIESPSRIPGLE
jgi:hypothetical protein